MLEAPLVRGSAVRSSLHTLTSNNNTSTPARRLDKPAVMAPNTTKEKQGVVSSTTTTTTTTTDVASVVNLGGAGSRRTVYLDEDQIKADTINRSPTNSINMGQTAASSKATPPVPTTTIPAATNGTPDGTGEPAPTTLLMYNRISNIIAPLASSDGDNKQQSSEKFGSSSSQNSNGNNKGGLEDKEKESAIWYEYGCV